MALNPARHGSRSVTPALQYVKFPGKCDHMPTFPYFTMTALPIAADNSLTFWSTARVSRSAMELWSESAFASSVRDPHSCELLSSCRRMLPTAPSRSRAVPASAAITTARISASFVWQDLSDYTANWGSLFTFTYNKKECVICSVILLWMIQFWRTAYLHLIILFTSLPSFLEPFVLFA